MPEGFRAKLIEFSEEERRRIARDLHDDIGQRLALLADDADKLRRELILKDDSGRLRLDNLVNRARGLSEDLRRISHNLHPAIVDDLGLLAALRSLVADFAERRGMPATFVGVTPLPMLPNELNTHLFRIVQEALFNISKHAGETPVKVTLTDHLGDLILVISDLGKGFDAASQGGLGLTSMRERAHLAGGTFSITSAPGKGTTIQICVPIPHVDD